MHSQQVGNILCGLLFSFHVGDLWWTKWHLGRFSSKYFSFTHSTTAPNSYFIHLPPIIINWWHWLIKYFRDSPSLFVKSTTTTTNTTRVVKQMEDRDLVNTKTVWSHIYIRNATDKKVPVYCDNDKRIPFCYWYIHNTISVWTIVRPEYNTWRFSFTILPYYSTALTFRRLMSTIVDVPHRYPPKFHFIYLFNKYLYRIF